MLVQASFWRPAYLLEQTVEIDVNRVSAIGVEQDVLAMPIAQAIYCSQSMARDEKIDTFTLKCIQP